MPFDWGLTLRPCTQWVLTMATIDKVLLRAANHTPPRYCAGLIPQDGARRIGLCPFLYPSGARIL